jgi:hypothetical protein
VKAAVINDAASVAADSGRRRPRYAQVMEQIKEVFAMATVIAPTIYEQLGGMDVIGMVVDEFYGRVLADDTLSPYSPAKTCRN